MAIRLYHSVACTRSRSVFLQLALCSRNYFCIGASPARCASEFPNFRFALRACLWGGGLVPITTWPGFRYERAWSVTCLGLSPGRLLVFLLLLSPLRASIPCSMLYSGGMQTCDGMLFEFDAFECCLARCSQERLSDLTRNLRAPSGMSGEGTSSIAIICCSMPRT